MHPVTVTFFRPVHFRCDLVLLYTTPQPLRIVSMMKLSSELLACMMPFYLHVFSYYNACVLLVNPVSSSETVPSRSAPCPRHLIVMFIQRVESSPHCPLRASSTRDVETPVPGTVALSRVVAPPAKMRLGTCGSYDHAIGGLRAWTMNFQPRTVETLATSHYNSLFWTMI